jgi:DNA-binding LytR/AlgR family response regulator
MTAPLPRRFLVQLAAGRWRAVDLEDVYYVEAEGHDCRVRLRERAALPDTRRLAELEALLGPAGFVRIHRSLLVNPRRVPGAAAAQRWRRLGGGDGATRQPRLAGVR